MSDLSKLAILFVLCVVSVVTLAYGFDHQWIPTYETSESCVKFGICDNLSHTHEYIVADIAFYILVVATPILLICNVVALFSDDDGNEQKVERHE